MKSMVCAGSSRRELLPTRAYRQDHRTCLCSPLSGPDGHFFAAASNDGDSFCGFPTGIAAVDAVPFQCLSRSMLSWLLIMVTSLGSLRRFNSNSQTFAKGKIKGKLKRKAQSRIKGAFWLSRRQSTSEILDRETNLSHSTLGSAGVSRPSAK